MKSDIAIRCEGLSKRYRIGERESYKALRDVITDGVASPFRAVRSALRNGNGNSQSTLPSALSPLPEIRHPNSEIRNSFLALDDVSFDVKRGEVVGIIGRNGAGKSTLLKILSRITKPTKGHAEIHGRVGSLLEVGTGFHPELTGGENIYLNAAILGMRKSEVQQKFDEIVSFAEVEKFIDTPVKRYSSGMYVRLAFAVAAHLDPEILVIDEVLAVGDAGFQQKCLRKIGSSADEGRTIVFVSHNMTAIESLCTFCLCLHDGRIVGHGKTSTVVANYLRESSLDQGHASLESRLDRTGSGEGRFTGVRFLDEKGQPVSAIPMGSSLTIEADYKFVKAVNEPVIGFLFSDRFGNTVLRAYSHESYAGPTPRINGNGTVRCILKNLPLMHGSYNLHLWLSQHRYPIDYVENAVAIEIARADVYQTGRAPEANNGGICFVTHDWEFFNER